MTFCDQPSYKIFINHGLKYIPSNKALEIASRCSEEPLRIASACNIQFLMGEATSRKRASSFIPFSKCFLVHFLLGSFSMYPLNRKDRREGEIGALLPLTVCFPFFDFQKVLQAIGYCIFPETQKQTKILIGYLNIRDQSKQHKMNLQIHSTNKLRFRLLQINNITFCSTKRFLKIVQLF